MGKFTDPATGWSYHGARWMEPQTARWLTPDSRVKGWDNAAFRLNPYVYAQQAPSLYWDPSGNFDEPIHGALTYQLAMAAGFTENDAAVLALQTAGVDHNPATEPVSFGNVVSGVTHDMHFASPSDALSRVISQFSEGSEMDMVSLGKALHTLEDVGFNNAPGPHAGSYLGHPFKENEDGSISAPVNHTADQAYRNPNANRKELKEVFDTLVDAAKAKYGKDVQVDTKAANRAIDQAVSADTREKQIDFMNQTPAGADSSYMQHVDQNYADQGDWIDGTRWTSQWVDISTTNPEDASSGVDEPGGSN